MTYRTTAVEIVFDALAWDQSLYVVNGNIAFGVGDKDMIADPDAVVHLG